MNFVHREFRSPKSKWEFRSPKCRVVRGKAQRIKNIQICITKIGCVSAMLTNNNHFCSQLLNLFCYFKNNLLQDPLLVTCLTIAVSGFTSYFLVFNTPYTILINIKSNLRRYVRIFHSSIFDSLFVNIALTQPLSIIQIRVFLIR